MLTTTANIMGEKNPGLALRFWPGDGQAQAVLAEKLIGPDIAGDHGKARILAARALASEPISARAVRVLGFIDEQAGQRANARKLMLLASRLSRRDLATNLWLIEDAVSRNDVTATLHRYDVALRTSALAPRILFPILADALADPAIVIPATTMFKKDPPWLERFLYEAVGHDKALPALVQIFMSLPNGTPSLTVPLKARLLARLVDTGNLDLAHLLYGKISNNRNEGLVRATAFQSASRWPPFDWELVSNGDVRGEIEGGEVGLSIYAGSGLGGMVARQLLTLKSGLYRISSRSRIAKGDGSLSWYVRCADKEGKVIAALRLQSNTRSESVVARRFAVPAVPSCVYQWLALELDANFESDGVEGYVREIAIEPLRSGASAS